MNDIYKWTLEIVKLQPAMSWLDDRRDEWVPLLASKLGLLMEGKAFLVFSDNDRDWFVNYIIKKINKPTNERPLLPFFSLREIYPNFVDIRTKESMQLLDDMLNIAFPNGVVYFYIGRENCPFSEIAKSKEDSYMWLMDNHVQNSFFLDNKDGMLDIRLIQLFALFDSSVNAVLFNEVIL